MRHFLLITAALATLTLQAQTRFAAWEEPIHDEQTTMGIIDTMECTFSLYPPGSTIPTVVVQGERISIDATHRTLSIWDRDIDDPATEMMVATICLDTGTCHRRDLIYCLTCTAAKIVYAEEAPAHNRNE